MYVMLYIRVHVCYLLLLGCVRMYMFTCEYIHVCLHMYIRMYVRVYTYTRVYVLYVYVDVCLRVRGDFRKPTVTTVPFRKSRTCHIF